MTTTPVEWLDRARVAEARVAELETRTLFSNIDRDRLRRMEWLYEALARAECRRQGIDPDDVIADGGHLAWHLVGYEAAVKEMPEPGAVSDG
jgi:hypothetical protein